MASHPGLSRAHLERGTVPFTWSAPAPRPERLATLSGLRKVARNLTLEPVTRWSQSGGVSHLVGLDTRPGTPQPDQTGQTLSGRGSQAPTSCARFRGWVFRAALNAQTDGCVSRRDLRLMTVRQGEQGRGCRRARAAPAEPSGLEPSVHGTYPGLGIVPDPRVLQRHGHAGNFVVGRGAVTAAIGHDHAADRDAIPADSPHAPRPTPVSLCPVIPI